MLLVPNFSVSEKQLSSKWSIHIFFFKLIALTLGSKSVNRVGFIKIVEEVKFEGVCDKLESKYNF